MFTKTGRVDNIIHTFTSEKDFIFQEDWILQAKGKEVFDAWFEKNKTGEATTHPDCIALYEEWLEDQGITHTMEEVSE